MRLVQALEGSAEKIDIDATKELLRKVEELQSEYVKKIKEYEETVSRHTEERRALSQK